MDSTSTSPAGDAHPAPGPAPSTISEAVNAPGDAESNASTPSAAEEPSATCEPCHLHRIFAGKTWIHVHMKQRRDCFTIMIDDDGTAYYGRILDQGAELQDQEEPESDLRRRITVSQHFKMYRRIDAAIHGLDPRLSLLSRFPEDVDSPPPIPEQAVEPVDPVDISTLPQHSLPGQLRRFPRTTDPVPAEPQPSSPRNETAPPPQASGAEGASRQPESRSEVPPPSERQARGDKALIWTGQHCSECISAEKRQQFRSFVHIHSPSLLICTSLQLKPPFKPVCQGCLGSPVRGPHPDCPEGQGCKARHPMLREGGSYPGHHSYRPPRNHLSIRDSERWMLLRVRLTTAVRRAIYDHYLAERVRKDELRARRQSGE